MADTQSQTSNRKWHMTAARGKKWSLAMGGKTVVLDEGIWENGRWLNPDEIAQKNEGANEDA